MAVLLWCSSLPAADPAALAPGAATRARALLEELVAADTTNPPGNEARAAAAAARRLREAGVAVEMKTFAPGRDNLVARVPGGREAAVLLLAHSDVVGTEGQPWTTEPRPLVEKDGHLYGRGVFDDLGWAAIAVEVLAALREHEVPLRRDVVFAFTGDEESGGAGIRHLLGHDRDTLAAAVALNEGGRVVLADDGTVKLVELQVAEKIYQDFELVAEGPTGHSSVPLADNAIHRLGAAIARIGGHTFPVRLLPVTRAYFRARAAVEPEPVAGAMRALAEAEGELPVDAVATLLEDPVHAATLRTTCVTTLVDGGSRENALPARASANVNCRILPDETIEGTQATLERVVGDRRIAIRPVGVSGAGPPSPLRGPAIEAIRGVLGEMWPGVPVVPSLSRGATDSRYIRAAGIDAYGLHVIPMTEGDARRAHGVDERIPADGLETGFELLYRLVIALAGKH